MIHTMTGKVVSTKTANMVIVAVTQIRRHRLYRKAIRKTRRFAAHNDKFELVIGDGVVISEIKPMSKTKHFVVTQKI